MAEWQHPSDAGRSYACAALDSPIGPLAIAVTPAGLLVLSFGGLERVQPMAARAGLVAGALAEQVDQVGVELAEYFAGRRQVFTVPVDWRLSSGFAGRTLRELATTVRYGETVSYGELARRVVQDRAPGHDVARAVGRAMATNPVAVVVPCHRVVASDGSLHGFGGGLETKRRLLALEGVLPQTLDDLLALG